MSLRIDMLRRKRQHNIKMELKKLERDVRIGFVWLKYGKMAGLCKLVMKFPFP
jgi:hypothetical protein